MFWNRNIRNCIEKFASGVQLTQTGRQKNSVLEDKTFEITVSEKQKDKRMKKNQQCLGDLLDTIKKTNLYVM